MADDTRDTSAGPRYLTVEEVAAELRVSNSHAYNLVYRGRLPHADFGTVNKKLIRVRRDHLDAYIEGSERP